MPENCALGILTSYIVICGGFRLGKKTLGFDKD